MIERELSNHRKLQFRAALTAEPERIRIFTGAVHFVAAGIRIGVLTHDWRVYMPFCAAESRYLQSLGVGERAKELVRSGKGERIRTRLTGQAALFAEAQQEAMGRRPAH